MGFFVRKPLTDFVAIRPTFETAFSNLCLRQFPKVYATSFDLGLLAPFMVSLAKPNKHGIIYLARNMSCYLTTKQPYVLLGPKLNFKKFDKGFKHKGFQNEWCVGALIGYGIQYEFHGTKVAPEICYSFELTKQNRITMQQKITHAISLTINVF